MRLGLRPAGRAAGPGPGGAWRRPPCPFLFEPSFSIYGGNLLSTLAGEFSFSLSLSLALLFLGVVAAGLRTGRHRALAAVLLGRHPALPPIPALFAVAGAGVWLLLDADLSRAIGPQPAGGGRRAPVGGRVLWSVVAGCRRARPDRLVAGALRAGAVVHDRHGLHQGVRLPPPAVPRLVPVGAGRRPGGRSWPWWSGATGWRCSCVRHGGPVGGGRDRWTRRASSTTSGSCRSGSCASTCWPGTPSPRSSRAWPVVARRRRLNLWVRDVRRRLSSDDGTDWAPGHAGSPVPPPGAGRRGRRCRGRAPWWPWPPPASPWCRRWPCRPPTLANIGVHVGPDQPSAWAAWNYSGYERKPDYPEFAAVHPDDAPGRAPSRGADGPCGSTTRRSTGSGPPSR